MNYYKLLFLLFCILYFRVSAQNHSFNKIPTKEGDANLSVRRVLQDNQGYLWIATFSGLYKYSGDDYVYQHQFRNSKQINSDVTALIEDNSDNIWIGTNDGLSKYNPETEELITYRPEERGGNSIGSNKIRSLAIDDNNHIWIGTYDKGLFLYNQQKDNFTKIDFKKYTNTFPNSIRAIFPDKDKIWFGTLHNGLYCFTYQNEEVQSLKNFRVENESQFLSHNHVYEIFKDNDGTMAIGTRGGLNVFNTKLNKFEDISSEIFPPGSMTNYFRSVCRDRNGKLWIGTWGGLILCDSFSDIENGKYQLITYNRNISNSISNSQIMDIFQDKSGIIWVTTENGLNRYDPYFNQFKPLHGPAINELREQSATDFYPWKNGMLILSLFDGLIEKQEEQLLPFLEKDTYKTNNEKFYSLLVDSENNIWVGSYNGFLVKIDGKTKAISTFKHSSNNIPIYSINELQKNTLAIGTFGEGLKYFDIKTGKFREEKGLSSGIQINAIHCDSKNRMWVATETGIFKKDKNSNSFHYYLPDNPDSILNPNIFIAIAESESNEIFIGGRNGLYIYNENTKSFSTKTFDKQNQLWVTNLQFDSEQNLWLNLNFNKIAKWDRGTNLLIPFNVNNGIRSSSYNRRGFFIDKNDRILISGFDQIFEFDATKPVINNYSPTPVFTNLLINNIDIHTDTRLNDQQIIKRNIAFEEKIELNSRNKDFSVSFTSSSYLNMRENKYRYMLHGYDKEWHIGKERTARYTNLRPGRYTFEVYSANNDGVWCTKPARLQMRIKPAPLLSFYAFTLYIIAFIIILYFSRRIILARMKLKKELLVEKVKRDKEEKFHQERLRFYTNISHELRTPLSLILGPTKQLISSDKPIPPSSRLLQLVMNNSQRMLSLVNQLLDFRKSLHQGMKLKVTRTNLVEIIESNIEAFAYMAEEKHIHVEFKSSERKLNGWFDLEKLDIILFNILSNAFKYTPDYGLVNLELNMLEANKNMQTQHVELKISNTGKGIPQKLQEKVFERYFQVSDAVKSSNINTGTGTGIGLALVKNVVELHHGKIALESIPGESTTFTIILPVNKNDYSEEEIFDFSRDADRRTKELIKTIDARKEETFYNKKDAEKKKLLIVEDNQELRDYLAGFLSQEYKVYAATNGEEGLERCKEKNPDMVVSDIMMENMDGLQFCKTLKSTPEISHIPVILMTALASVENKLEGYKTGADDYITKPFDPELLRIRIEKILENLTNLKKKFGKDFNLSSKELTVSKIDEEFLNKVIALIEENIDNSSFDIDSFCKNLGISSSQLYRKIKSITGVSPNEFIRTFRLRKAAELILESKLSISEIAYKVGFNDALYFSKCFKKQFGTSPSKYIYKS
ncbi:two-component regulator propeller domain-containing protein [uncultured Draconibacterium sp.]|uniref:two-component regulator propeller domain-containing protein n=1 Tax=uncultured Draconibacterium sp. TaxID=1573823 RepID=UPI0025FD5C5E|nr:two-component regulator propeller domain-containing protein [uncultured Draconibacterium sp.]